MNRKLLIVLAVVGAVVAFYIARKCLTRGGGGGSSLIYFYSQSCSHCKNFKPRLDEFEKNNPINVERIDVGSAEGRDETEALEKDFKVQVRAVPSVMLLDEQGKKAGSQGVMVQGVLVKPPQGLLVY